jgi:hypothetical protein
LLSTYKTTQCHNLTLLLVFLYIKVFKFTVYTSECLFPFWPCLLNKKNRLHICISCIHYIQHSTFLLKFSMLFWSGQIQHELYICDIMYSHRSLNVIWYDFHQNKTWQLHSCTNYACALVSYSKWLAIHCSVGEYACRLQQDIYIYIYNNNKCLGIKLQQYFYLQAWTVLNLIFFVMKICFKKLDDGCTSQVYTVIYIYNCVNLWSIQLYIYI